MEMIQNNGKQQIGYVWSMDVASELDMGKKRIANVEMSNLDLDI